MSAIATDTDNSAVQANQHADTFRRASSALKASATFWLAVTSVGMWAFLIFILAFYGSTSLTGNFGSCDPFFDGVTRMAAAILLRTA